MQRVTITLDDDLLASIDGLAASRGYGSRSEALRDILRDALAREATETGNAPSYAALTYVYDHETRDLARRLAHVQHGHHDLTVASLHVHLDAEQCLEVAILRGPAEDLRSLADEMISQRGVRFGRLHLVPDGKRDGTHGHDGPGPS